MEASFARRAVGSLAAAIVGFCAPYGTGSAQSFPSKPIEFVVHTSPGGGTDLFARAVAEFVGREKVFSQPLVVSNKPGGSGVTAFSYVKSKKGDPHVVLTMATGSFLSAANRPELGLGLEQFTPIGSFALDPQAIAVPWDSKFKTVKDLIEAGKREPNAIVSSITSATGTARVLLYLIERETGAKFKYVSFKSGSEATTAVVGGHVAFTPENLSEMLGFVEGKKMRILAVTGNKRLAAVPDAPTMKEAGYNITVGTGRGFVMAAGVPKDAAAAMEAALKRVHGSAAWQEFSKRNNFEDMYMGSAEFGKYLAGLSTEMSAFLAHIGAPAKQ
ncbi:MAG: Bug family tripartite tricarboxylate transporter substrate binding protein [Burkholderiales bacterium]